MCDSEGHMHLSVCLCVRFAGRLCLTSVISEQKQRHIRIEVAMTTDQLQQRRDQQLADRLVCEFTLTPTTTTTHPHTHLTALFPGLPGWAGTRKVKPIWISLKQEKVSGSAISWVICKSAPRSRQITTPAPHHSVFYRPDALPTAQPIASKH